MSTTGVAIFLSGRGSNFVALHEAMQRGEVPAKVSVVVSNEPRAGGVAYAEQQGLPVEVIPHRGAGGRKAHERLVLAALDRYQVDWICLAGYMRLLSAAFVDRFAERILNIHPSLLPSFPGLAVQQAALDHGVRITGCTVHLVDSGLDSGPIVVQRAVPVLDEDEAESLSARILEQEHKAYPEALSRLLSESWRIEGRRVRFGVGASGTPA
ncbi:MAG: phosphoribosylglycinamide formyltransferase [Acidobacteriota bacterium]